MGTYINIKKGLDIRLVGEAENVVRELPMPETFAIKPPDFIDLTPKLLVKEGDEVQAGTPLFYNKIREEVKFCSPVSGEVIGIVRGEKRQILEVKVLADKEITYLPFTSAHPADLSREAIVTALLNSGLWPFIRQRPYGIIAHPDDIPKAIFISAFDSHPLAPDYNFLMHGTDEDFQSGVDALRKLTKGAVHLTLAKEQNATVFTKAKGVEFHTVSGPHPAGNVGVHIHRIDPINKGEVVWHMNPQDVLMVGRLFNRGVFDATRIVALTGAQVKRPGYYKTLVGHPVHPLLADAGLKEGANRVISGNVLTGKQISDNGYLNFYEAQVTVIPEGNEPEFMGWLAPGLNKFSMSRAFFSWLSPRKKYNLNSNMHGEERPFVITGQYEQVFPMDIYPVQLLKAVLIEDIELMEELGIYEVVEEDFALCEFVCTSKIEAQDIIRRGLDIVRKEMGA